MRALSRSREIGKKGESGPGVDRCSTMGKLERFKDWYHFRVVFCVSPVELAYQLLASECRPARFSMFKADAWLNIHFHISRYVSNVKYPGTVAGVTWRRKGEMKEEKEGRAPRNGLVRAETSLRSLGVSPLLDPTQ